MVSTTDLKVYKTTNNLGGAITATQVSLATPNNLFTTVSRSAQVSGEDYYACVFLKNDHSTEKMKNFKFWLNTKSLPNDTEIKWGWEPGDPDVAQIIPDKYTAPTGITWRGVEAEPTTSSEIGNGGKVAIWLWYHVNANAESRLDDNEIFKFKFDIPLGGTGSTGGGTGGDSGGTGGNPPPTVENYKIAVVGDEGCGSTTNSVKNRIVNNNYDYVISVGDHAYASASCWTSTYDSLKSKMESAYGNHEYSESGGTTPYKTFFGHSKTYLTFKFRNMQFFIIDTNIDCDIGGTQHTFISNAITQSKTDSTIVWRVAIFHHPMYGSSSDHTYNVANTRQNFHSLFQSNGIRIVCTGHNHNWQRTHMIAYNSGSTANPTVVDSTSPYSNDSIGIIHVISGTGGHDSASNLYGLGSKPSYQQYQNNTHNGFWEMVSSNGGNTLTCSFVDVSGDKFDTFIIENT